MLDNFFYIGLFILIAAILLDLWIGDPSWLPHPVIQMGKLISFFEKKWNRGRRLKGKGVLLTATVVCSVYVLILMLVYLFYQVHFLAGVLLEVYFISTTIAIKGLAEAAKNVLAPLKDGNLIEARRSLSMIVGRDTERLPENEIVRGTVETVAENTVDGITAPLFWAIVGGAPLAMAYRAINTLDSMVGYKNEQYRDFGWASARLDDLANWIPARLTALAMWVFSIFIKGSKRKNAWNITWRDAKKHPSPNSGWSEAMVAGLLGTQLGGVNYYKGEKSTRATMGDDSRNLETADINMSIRYMHSGWVGFIIIGTFFLFFINKLI